MAQVIGRADEWGTPVRSAPEGGTQAASHHNGWPRSPLPEYERLQPISDWVKRVVDVEEEADSVGSETEEGWNETARSEAGYTPSRRAHFPAELGYVTSTSNTKKGEKRLTVGTQLAPRLKVATQKIPLWQGRQQERGALGRGRGATPPGGRQQRDPKRGGVKTSVIANPCHTSSSALPQGRFGNNQRPPTSARVSTLKVRRG